MSPCLCVCRGFPVKTCIMLKHLSKEAEETPLGSQSPPAKRSCPDLQVNHKLETRTGPFQARPKSRCDLWLKHLIFSGYSVSLCPAVPSWFKFIQRFPSHVCQIKLSRSVLLTGFCYRLFFCETDPVASTFLNLLRLLSVCQLEVTLWTLFFLLSLSSYNLGL